MHLFAQKSANLKKMTLVLFPALPDLTCAHKISSVKRSPVAKETLANRWTIT